MAQPTERSELAQRIRTLRTSKGLNQSDFGEVLGVSQRTIYRIEKGERDPSIELVTKVCDEFGVSLSWLVRGGREDTGSAPGSHEIDEEALTTIVSEAVRTFAARGQPRHQRLPLYDIEGDVPPLTYGRDLPATPTDRYIHNPLPDGDPNAFACQLADDSMFPEFREGDILIFSPAADPESGAYACVRLDDATTFRRVFFVDEDQVRLVALNSYYPELRIGRSNVLRYFRLVWRLSPF